MAASISERRGVDSRLLVLHICVQIQPLPSKMFLSFQEHSKLVFVPGPNDPGPAAVFPRPPLPALLTQKLREMLPNAVFASNPCRIQYYTQEVVIFRDDLQKRMRQLCLRPPVEGTGLRTLHQALSTAIASTV